MTATAAENLPFWEPVMERDPARPCDSDCLGAESGVRRTSASCPTTDDATRSSASQAGLPADLPWERLTTYSLHDRPSKVHVGQLGRPLAGRVSFSDWLESLPQQLAAVEIRRLRDAIVNAVRNKHTVVAAIGGHVVKTGCSPYLNDWIQRGILHAVAMNGSAAIHDFELACAGKTSEDVAAQLPQGKFGMARETAAIFARAAERAAREGIGLGAALGACMVEDRLPYLHCSLVATAYQAGIPCTVHVALGTDIVHMHPQVRGADLGEASLTDFRKLCGVVAGLAHGIWMNLGSAVIMPEVFLKAVSVARNLGYSLQGLLTVNLDKHVQYRSRVNVCERPADASIEIIGHHEILIPLLHAAVICALAAPVADGAVSHLHQLRR